MPASLDSTANRNRAPVSSTAGNPFTTPVTVISRPSHSAGSASRSRHSARTAAYPNPATQAAAAHSDQPNAVIARVCACLCARHTPAPASAASTNAPHVHSTAPGNAACRCSATTPSMNAIHHTRIPPPRQCGAAVSKTAPFGNDYAEESARRGNAAHALAEVDSASVCASMPRSSASTAPIRGT